MAGGDAIGQINRLFGPGTIGGLTDGQLLERFTTRRGEAAESAFEGLVARHGPMVVRVCRALLRDPHDVEDAFQATFLVLVRRAGSIGERDLLGPWLYGVARRVSLKARGLATRRRSREGGLGIVDDPPADLAEGPWLDLRPVLHEELDRLPEKYRRPVVLCHLQGLTHAEAAQELAWPVGTVSVRLARARKLLGERLTRRGLTATATLWAAGLAAEGTSAAVPQALLRSTTLAATALTAGRPIAAGAVSAVAWKLAQGVSAMMFFSQWKWVAAMLVLGTSTAGAVAIAIAGPNGLRARSGQAAPEGQAPPGQAEAAPKAGLGVASGETPLLRLAPPPPGYFDLPPREKKDGTPPLPLVEAGHVISVEVLEALPGRPITGERFVRPDGTISLGFYGDLAVAGLNRAEIKVRVIEHLRKFLGDEVLGLVEMQGRRIPPAESNRVYVSDDASFGHFYASGIEGHQGLAQVGQVIQVEVLQALPGRPITGERVVGPDGSINLGFYGDVQVVGLKRDQIKVKVIERLRKLLTDEIIGLVALDEWGQARAVPPVESNRVFVNDIFSAPGRRTPDAIRELRGKVDDLDNKLDRVLGELEKLRKDMGQPKGR